MRQIHFLLESGYFVTVVNFVVNEQDNYFWDIRKQCLIGLYFRDIFPIGNFHYDHLVLLCFKTERQNKCYQLLKW